MTVAIVGASGKTGRAVWEALGRRRVAVRPIGRAQLGNLEDALSECDLLYLIAPNLYADEPAFVASVLAAAGAARVRRVVYHSVASPYAPSMPHHLGKAFSEDLVRRGSAEWTILQPGAYVQNFVPALLEPHPALRVPYDVTRRFGLVDLQDVGDAAAAVMLEDSHAGATYELGGPAMVSVTDVAHAAANVLDADVPAERVEPGDWATGPGAGLGERERDWLLAMFAYYDAHGLPVGSRMLEALLGRRPTALHATVERELTPSR